MSSSVQTTNVTNLNLTEAVWVDYEVLDAAGDGVERRTVVRVMFPQEARALLELLPWSEATRITDVIGRMGATYLVHVLETGGLNPSFASSGAEAATFDLPLDYFRSKLESRAHRVA
jgi:hypothetical protein